MGQSLDLKGIWQAPGYRSLTLSLIDPVSKREYDVHLSPKDLQHLINECADAAKQIGTEPPIDWDQYPSQVYWPTITPWKVGCNQRGDESH